jgi:hypothetical protein
MSLSEPTRNIIRKLLPEVFKRTSYCKKSIFIQDSAISEEVCRYCNDCQFKVSNIDDFLKALSLPINNEKSYRCKSSFLSNFIEDVKNVLPYRENFFEISNVSTFYQEIKNSFKRDDYGNIDKEVIKEVIEIIKVQK